MRDADTAIAVEFDPFAGPEIARLAPITEPQAEIWAACLVGGDDANRAYNESIALRLTGQLDRDALQCALTKLVEQHDALRTVFSTNGQYLCILEPTPLPLVWHDLNSLPPAEQQEWLAVHAQTQVQQAFDLVAGPLVRASLVKLSATEHQLTLTMHHIVCDGWSIGVLLQDLGAFYSAYAQHLLPLLPAPPSFSSYAEEQANFYKTEEYQRIEQFWVAQYQDSVPVLDLPTDFPRPSTRTYVSRRQDYSLSPALVGALKKVGQRVGSSFVTTLLATFEVLLYHLTGQNDLVVGLPAAGQAAIGAERLVGHCVNLLPLRSRLNGDILFDNFLKQRKTAVLDAYDHQNLTFGSLLKKLSIHRIPGRIPLVPVVFNIDMGLDNNVAFQGLEHRLSSVPRAYESFELFVNASGSEANLVIEWSYNATLFEAATIDQMMTQFERLIGEIIKNPTAKLDELREPVSLDASYVLLNATAQPYPTTQTLQQLLDAQAHATPHQIAIQFGSTETTYRQLVTQANQLAHYLLIQGVQSGYVVALALDRSPSLLVAMLAVLKCGAAYLPLDPGYPKERIAYMLADADAKLFIVSSQVANNFNTIAPTVCLEEIISLAADCATTAPVVHVSSNQLAYVLYTSGSTGKPKGVQVTHRNLVNFLCSMRQVPGIDASDKLLAVTTISFDIAGLELFLPLVAGATVVVAEETVAKDGRLLLQLLETAQITIMQATPATWRMLLSTGWNKWLPLKALCGGEALPADLAKQMLNKCQSLWNMYGPTETTIWSSIKQITDPTEQITIGQPIANTQFYIVDENLLPVKPGTVGEIIIGGDGVANGYLHKPELTSEKFVNNPFSSITGSKMYRTGDLGKLLPNGEVQCLGRLDQQIKLRGYRIEPGEIEAILTSLSGINTAVVSCENHSGHTHLHAYIIVNEAIQTSDIETRISEWKKGLGKQLPSYMVPTRFTILPTFPLTANGKIDRKALAEADLNDIVSNITTKEEKTNYIAPRTDVEKLVATIWAKLLDIEKVGIYDDFFELGGHSLIAVQAMAQLEKETGKRLPLAALFEHSTVEKIASMLQLESKFIVWDSLVPIRAQGTKAPLYIVHGAGLNVLIFNALAKNMNKDQPVYALQAQGLNGIDNPLDTVEQMAAHYVAAILKNDPIGPYSIAGYSFGGIIAFEMTKQLQAMGKKVKVLIAFDTYAYEEYTVRGLFNKRLIRSKYRLNTAIHNVALLSKDPKGIINHRITHLKSNLNKFHHKLIHSKETTPEATYTQAQKISSIVDRAAQQYTITPQEVALELFKVNDPYCYVHDKQSLGWSKFALQGVHIHEIPGEHNLLFAPPHDAAIARILQDVLDSYE